MLKTFKQFLLENTDTGNYVCIDSTKLDHFLEEIGLQEPITGKTPPGSDYHCTLMYSTDSDVNSDRVKSLLSSKFPFDFGQEMLYAYSSHFECFDSLPEDGVRSEAKSCIVMELDCPTVVEMNKYLSTLGLKHSYPDFKPHVTLRYNMSIEEAHYYKDKLNDMNLRKCVVLNGFKSQPINKNYV